MKEWEGSNDGNFREPLDVCVKFSILESYILQRAHKLVGTEKCSLPCSLVSHPLFNIKHKRAEFYMLELRAFSISSYISTTLHLNQSVAQHINNSITT